ncbi:pilus (MSHA type) biogenesis protein MshL [Candidatus Albibeggiatoa sp. nov. NOAA]|uniref:pilus (MSHA type) biogenesis protein MshL n=1 Tax=Candidatus Albibeggiatoa sp. nov. NOAA TaxID=3162724 RepID=UPI0032F1B745|nr:pilus (MSHA type) biogenesis protein MshL [Thiotrichaceae bacterium]
MSVITACAPQPQIPSPGHINTEQLPTKPELSADIPPPVQQMPFIPPPQPSQPLETYTVTVTNVPVDQLLFALARDAEINIDVHPSIKGNVTLNAIEQTLPQIMQRIAEQIELRYEIKDTYVKVFPDLPYLRLYKVNYVNMSRQAVTEVKVSTQSISNIEDIADTGQGSSSSGGSDEDENNSTTQVRNTSNNLFWQTLTRNINSLLGSIEENNPDVVVNAETGIVMINAKHHQHAKIQTFLDSVLESAQRQVLIEATIAEVTLKDEYQAGIDWKRISGDYTYEQSLTNGQLNNTPFYSIEYTNPDSVIGNVTAAVRLLEQFGNVKVLSSPKIMVLNNQTAVLKVVDNIVYFNIDIVPQTQATNVSSGVTFVNYVVDTEPKVLPVGLIMNVTPQISDTELVTLNVRPTISRITKYVQDPNPELAQAGVSNPIPQIQVREMESILRVGNGNIVIIGGLMEDSIDQETNAVPVLSKLPLVGDLFTYKHDTYSKTELVIFLRPVIVKDASLEGDLKQFKTYLPDSQSDNYSNTGIQFRR